MHAKAYPQLLVLKIFLIFTPLIMIEGLVVNSSAMDVEEGSSGGSIEISQEFDDLQDFIAYAEKQLPNYQTRFQSYDQQFQYYHQVYSDLDMSTYDPSKTHIEGLFTILQYGFFKAVDYINSDRTFPTKKRLVKEKGIKGKEGDLRTEGLRGEYTKYNIEEQTLKDLMNLYNLAFKLETQGKLSQQSFLLINNFMAVILDRYKGIESAGGNSRSKYDTTIIEDALTGKGEMFNEMSKDFLTYTKIHSREKKTKLEVYPTLVALIYGNDDEGLSRETFVDETFENDDFEIGIALFDIKSFLYPKSSFPYVKVTEAEKRYEKPGSKTMAHYSKFNSTFGFLTHDLNHILEQAEIEDILWDRYNLDLQTELRKINAIRMKLKKSDDEIDKNKYNILTNGLFILSHELNNVTATPLLISNSRVPKIKEMPEKGFTFIKLLYFIKEKMKYGVQELKDITLKPFPKTKLLREQKNEPKAPRKNDPTSQRRMQEDQKYRLDMIQDIKRLYKEDFRDQEESLKGIKDENGRSLIPENIPKDKKKEIIIKGYEKFWNYFIKILREEKAFK